MFNLKTETMEMIIVIIAILVIIGVPIYYQVKYRKPKWDPSKPKPSSGGETSGGGSNCNDPNGGGTDLPNSPGDNDGRDGGEIKPGEHF